MMNFVIENQSFYKIPKIIQVKTFVKRLGKYELRGTEVKGKIFVDIDYYDSNQQENFSTCQFDYSISVPEDVTVRDVVLKDLNIEVVDNQGINCLYALDIVGRGTFEPNQVVTEDQKYEEVSPSKKLVSKIIKEVDDSHKFDIEEEAIPLFKETTIIESIKVEQAKNEEIKQELQQEYDKKLQETLGNRNESRIEIITSKDDKDERGFLKFFDAFPSTYYKVKTLYVKDESDLNKISTDYNISLETLYRSYDKDKRTVVVKDGR